MTRFIIWTVPRCGIRVNVDFSFADPVWLCSGRLMSWVSLTIANMCNIMYERDNMIKNVPLFWSFFRLLMKGDAEMERVAWTGVPPWSQTQMDKMRGKHWHS